MTKQGKPEGCCGIVGFIFGHDFEPVFEEERGQATVVEEIIGIDPIGLSVTKDNFSDMIEATKSYKDKFVHTICKRCGQTIAKDSDT